MLLVTIDETGASNGFIQFSRFFWWFNSSNTSSGVVMVEVTSDLLDLQMEY